MNVEIDPHVLCERINAPIEEAKEAIESLGLLLKGLVERKNAVAIQAQLGGTRWTLIKEGNTWVLDAKQS